MDTSTKLNILKKLKELILSLMESTDNEKTKSELKEQLLRLDSSMTIENIVFELVRVTELVIKDKRKPTSVREMVDIVMRELEDGRDDLGVIPRVNSRGEEI